MAVFVNSITISLVSFWRLKVTVAKPSTKLSSFFLHSRTSLFFTPQKGHCQFLNGDVCPKAPFIVWAVGFNFFSFGAKIKTVFSVLRQNATMGILVLNNTGFKKKKSVVRENWALSSSTAHCRNYVMAFCCVFVVKKLNCNVLIFARRKNRSNRQNSQKALASPASEMNQHRTKRPGTLFLQDSQTTIHEEIQNISGPDSRRLRQARHEQGIFNTNLIT